MNAYFLNCSTLIAWVLHGNIWQDPDATIISRKTPINNVQCWWSCRKYSVLHANIWKIQVLIRQGKRQITISKHCGISDAIAISRNKTKWGHKRPVIQHLWSGSHLLEEGGEKLEFKRQRGSLGSMEQAWLVTLDLGPCGPAATQQSAPVLT